MRFMLLLLLMGIMTAYNFEVKSNTSFPDTKRLANQSTTPQFFDTKTVVIICLVCLLGASVALNCLLYIKSCGVAKMSQKDLKDEEEHIEVPRGFGFSPVQPLRRAQSLPLLTDPNIFSPQITKPLMQPSNAAYAFSVSSSETSKDQINDPIETANDETSSATSSTLKVSGAEEEKQKRRKSFWNPYPPSFMMDSIAYIMDTSLPQPSISNYKQAPFQFSDLLLDYMLVCSDLCMVPIDGFCDLMGIKYRNSLDRRNIIQAFKVFTYNESMGYSHINALRVMAASEIVNGGGSTVGIRELASAEALPNKITPTSKKGYCFCSRTTVPSPSREGRRIARLGLLRQPPHRERIARSQRHLSRCSRRWNRIRMFGECQA